MQGLAQIGLEVQAFNGFLLVGRVIGLIVASALLWFVVGPMLGEENPVGVIVAFFVLPSPACSGGNGWRCYSCAARGPGSPVPPRSSRIVAVNVT
jgi:hypothetical protein